MTAPAFGLSTLPVLPVKTPLQVGIELAQIAIYNAQPNTQRI